MQGDEGPYWLRLAGEERLDKELGALRRSVKAGKLPGVTKVSLPDDDLRCWRVKVEWLDPLTQGIERLGKLKLRCSVKPACEARHHVCYLLSCSAGHRTSPLPSLQAGMQFNTQLECVRAEHGPGHASLQLEISFGEAYPAEPFFLRIVRPRVKPFTVHVTEGGSVCLEALASCGGEHGWSPDRTVGGILQQLLRDLVLPPETRGRRADGTETAAADAAQEPRWPHWPLQIELGAPALEAGFTLGAGWVLQGVGGGAWGGTPGAEKSGPARLSLPLMQGYSLREAQDAFQLAAWKSGWASPPPKALLAAPAAASAIASLPGQPPRWELNDALLAGQTTYVELPLPGQPGLPGSPCKEAALAEAERVLQLWGARPHANSRVVRIERVQSLELWHRYHRRRELVEQESGLPDAYLFHGTSREALELICRVGFDVRLANRQGSLGAGLYFGGDSSTSESYCSRVFNQTAVTALGHQPAKLLQLGAAPAAGGAGATPRFQPGGRAMLLCRVAVGKAGRGGQGSKAPQPGCHSVASGLMHVVYSSDQAYPEYVIHFESF